MKQALSILEDLLAHLKEIQLALGDRWPEFARRVRELARLFEAPLDEAALAAAVDQLYGLFIEEDERVCEIITRPATDEATGSSRLPSNLSIEEIASRFYVFCQQADSLVQQLRLDAAAPDQVGQGQAFEVAVAVCPLSSPILTEDDLTHTRSGNVNIVWPESAPYVQLTIQIIAPACQIHGSDSFKFRLYAGHDSPVFYFMLTPRQVGEIGLVVRLYQEDTWLGNARVRIVCGQVTGSLSVTHSPLASQKEQTRWSECRTRLREMLEAHFNESELRTLCFDLGVDYDNLLHATKADAARELVSYLERRDRLPELVAVGQKLRPDVSWGEVPAFGQATA